MTKTDTFLYQEIAESLRRRIAAGELQPGDKLPPVREMARQWNCTPGTVSRAYAQLAQERLVAGYRGGGTQVTPSALHTDRPLLSWTTLVNRAESFLLEALSSGHTPVQAEAALSVAIARWEEYRRQETPVTLTSEAGHIPVLRFAGSHDLTIDLLARMLSAQAVGVELSIEFVGSLGGLMALARGEADVAGTHLWDKTRDTYNTPFVRRFFPGRRVALLTVAHRSLGLILPAGNPQQLQGLADLERPSVQLINRQTGSGTRVWLDSQLKTLNIAPESISGYDKEALTHLSVAQAIKEEQATVGLGIHSAAAAYGLDFITLTQERYDLAIPEKLWQSKPVQSIETIVRSTRFKQAVTALGGYDTSETGQETWIG